MIATVVDSVRSLFPPFIPQRPPAGLPVRYGHGEAHEAALDVDQVGYADSENNGVRTIS